MRIKHMKNGSVSLSEKQGSKGIAEKAIKNPELLEELFNGIFSKSPRTKFGSAKALRIISEKNPNLLYSRMDLFIKLLGSENTILKWIAIDIVANLTAADTNDDFNRTFVKFYSYLYEGSLITAGHVVDGSGKIVLSKPELADRITEKLLKVEEIPLPTSECRNILIGKTINAFGMYFHKIENKDEIIAFVKRHLNNSRNATRKKAERFLTKFTFNKKDR
jgi:hypothetical protein